MAGRRLTHLRATDPLRLSVALFFIALLPRLIFWWEWNHAGLLSLPIIDAVTFDQEARGLLAGTWPGPGAFWQAPLYSIFLGGIYRLFGPSWAAARLIQALLGAGSCLMVYLFARRVFERRWALAAYGICVLYAPLIYYEGQLLRETLATFLLLAWLLVQTRPERPALPEAPSRETGPWGSLLRGRVPQHLAAGILLGLASICRENALALALPALAWTLWKNRAGAGAGAGEGTGAGETTGAGKGRGRPRLLPPLAFVLGIALAVSPVTAHNWKAEHRLIPISWSGGLNFWLGNDADSRGALAIRPGRTWRQLVDRPVVEAGARSDAQRQDFFYGQAFRWIAAHPGGFLKNSLYKAVALVSAHEVKRNQDMYEGREGSRLLWILLWRAGPFGFPFGLIGPLALAGIFLFLWRGPRPDPMAFLLLVAAFFALGLVLFFPNARYRAPLIPLLASAAAWCLREWARSLRLARTQGGQALLAPALPLALSLLLVDGGWVRAVDSPADQSFQRSTFLAEQGKTDAALSELTRATSMDPRFEEAWETLAALHGKSGRYREAAQAARTATGLDSTDAEAWDDLGLARLGLLSSGNGNGPAGDGTPAEIEACFRTALRLDPGQTTARLQLQRLLLRRGETDEARALLQQGLDRTPQSAPLWSALGSLELHAGRQAEAVSALERAVHLGADDAEAWNQYALALIQRGRRDEALQALDQVLKLRPGNPQAEANRRRLLQLH